MNTEFLGNDDIRMFEDALKRDAPKGRCDFDRVENALFHGIQGAEEDGVLSLLKLDEILSVDLIERIECGLAKRIEQHIEYEMPVDDCIRGARDVHDRYWGFVENKLNKSIKNISSASLWEQALKTDEILSMGQWETVEQNVADGVAQSDGGPAWESALMVEETPPLGVLEKVEAGLEAKLTAAQVLQIWEKCLECDEIRLSAFFERVEKGLFSKINDFISTDDMVRTSLGTYFAITLLQLKKLRALGVALLVGCSIFGGYFAYRDNFTSIPLALYQVQGTRLYLFNSPLSQKGVIQSEKGGGLTFVTKKGYVELQNGSQLEIKKATEKRVEYNAAFADADNQLIGQGSATFFVNHQKKDERYIVTTHDYRVEVTGTYFRLQPDLGGHVSIAVREGSVNIVFNNGETRRLKAGQMLAYDLNSNAYATTSDGMAIARQDIEQLPDIKELSNYQQLSIATSPSAGVRIDGRFVGMSPLTIMQPAGTHSISVERNGYQTADTSVTLTSAGPRAMALTLMRSDAPARPQNVIVYEEVNVVDQLKPGQRPGPSAPAAGSLKPAAAETLYNENDFREAERFEAKNWKKAVGLYREIAGNPRAPHLQREAALFSIGKLEAERGENKTAANEAFLNYLALYPSGNFVGESWLRLAELEFGSNQDKAIEYYLRYFEHYPRHSRISELQHRVGLIYLQKKKYDEAIAMFKLSLANYQNDNSIDKGKIQTSLYKALKEKDDSQKTPPASAASDEQTVKPR